MNEPPDIRVLIDFVNDLNPTAYNSVTADPVWLDVTSKVRQGGFSFRRGRERPLDRNEAGTATIVFDNFEREFDPESLNSFGLVQSMRHIRIEAKHPRTTTAFKVGSSKVGSSDLVGGGDSFIYDSLFDGYIESWEFDYPGLGNDATATAKCMDLLGVMAKDNVNVPFAIDSFYADTALDYVLNLVPYAGRVPDSYNTTLPSPTERDWLDESVTSAGHNKYIIAVGLFTNVPVRTPIDAITEAEGGNFFINRSGQPAYRDHDWPLQPAGRVRVAIDAEKFHDVARNLDETLIYNYVYLTNPDLTQYGLAEDKASQARYLKRPYPVQDIGLRDAGDLQDRAENELFRHREPQVFLSRLDLSNLVTDWRKMLKVELWDIVTVEVPLPNGDVVSQRSMIEGIEISSPSSNIWNIVWQLSLPFFPNMLSADAAGFEGADQLGTTGGWTAETNCTLLPQNRQIKDTRHGGGRNDLPIYYTYEMVGMYAVDGAWVLQAEATGNGNVLFRSPSITVEPRRSYVCKVFGRLVHYGLVAGVPSENNPGTDNFRDVHLEIDWMAGLSVVSTTVGPTLHMGPLTNTPVTLWEQLTVDGLCPDTATSARIRVKSVGTLKTGIYIDGAAFKRGG